MSRHSVVLVGAATLLLGCGDPPGPGPIETSRLPRYEIVDGANHGGNAHFFFLPPLRPMPAPNGAFEGTLAPTVEICVLAQCGSSALVTFTTRSGEGSEVVRVDLAAEQYVVNWHTGRFDLDPAVTYRIRVLVDGRELGHADVDVVSRQADLKRVDEGEFIPVLNGRTVPIKFRIEQGFRPPPFNVISATATSNTAVAVTFDAPPTAGEAVTLQNYSIPGLTLSGTPVLAGNVVSLTTSSQSATTYEVTASGVTRASDGEVLANRSATFLGQAGTAPRVTISAPPAEGSVTNVTNASFTLSSDQPATLCWQLDAGALTCSGAGVLTFDANLVNLPSGAHTLAVTATTAGGNSGSATRNWMVDAVAPTVTISSPPAEGSVSNASTVSFTLSSSEPATLCWNLDGGAGTCSPSAVLSLNTGDLAVAPGVHTLAVRATDAAGNVTISSRNWVVQ